MPNISKLDITNNWKIIILKCFKGCQQMAAIFIFPTNMNYIIPYKIKVILTSNRWHLLIIITFIHYSTRKLKL